MVHDRAFGATGGRRAGLAQMQEHEHAGKPHEVEVAGLECGAAHGGEKLLVRLDAHRVEMPMAHGDARLVGRECLGQRRRRHQQRHEAQCRCEHSHGSPSRCLIGRAPRLFRAG